MCCQLHASALTESCERESEETFWPSGRLGEQAQTCHLIEIPWLNHTVHSRPGRHVVCGSSVRVACSRVAFRYDSQSQPEKRGPTQQPFARVERRVACDTALFPRTHLATRAEQGWASRKEGKPDKASRVTLGGRPNGHPGRAMDQESRFDQKRRQGPAPRARKGLEPTPAFMHACNAQTASGSERNSRTVDRSMPDRPLFEKEKTGHQPGLVDRPTPARQQAAGGASVGRDVGGETSPRGWLNNKITGAEADRCGRPRRAAQMRPQSQQLETCCFKNRAVGRHTSQCSCLRGRAENRPLVLVPGRSELSHALFQVEHEQAATGGCQRRPFAASAPPRPTSGTFIQKDIVILASTGYLPCTTRRLLYCTWTE
jgi:hypothetical protein